MRGKAAFRKISLITAVVILAVAFFIAVYPVRTADWVLIIALLAVAVYEFAKSVFSVYGSYFYVVQFGTTILGLVFVLLAQFALIDASVALMAVPAWAVANGAARIAAGVLLQQRVIYWKWPVVIGVIMAAAGAAMLILPAIGWLTMNTFIGMILGVIMFVAGIGSIADAFV